MRWTLRTAALSFLIASCGDGTLAPSDGSPTRSGNQPASNDLGVGSDPGATNDGQSGGPGSASGGGGPGATNDPGSSTNGQAGSGQGPGSSDGETNPTGGGTNSGSGSNAGSSGGGDGPLVGTPADAPLADCDTPGPRLIRRLTARQYDHTLTALLGDGAPTEVVLSDPAVLGFHVDADAALVSDLTAELLMNHTERVAAWAVENRIYELSPCTNHDPGCHRQFIENFGRKAYRQPLGQQQIDTYLAMFAAEASFEAGLHVVLTTMLQSPYLLYRQELGEPDPSHPGQYRLTPYEIATQLAYSLTDGPPDQQLLDAAAQNGLQTNEQIDQHAYRLLSRDQARAVLTHFVQGWLEIDDLFKKAKDDTLFQLTDPLRQAMLDQTSQFFLDTFQSGGTISDLFGARHTFVNGPLASLYGLNGVDGEGFSRVSLEGQPRASGLLGHASFLTQHSLPDNSSPVQRGVIVRERLLCHELPPVPENLDTNLAEGTNFANNRERYAQHSADPQCVGCHSVIDPVGFAFENYDAFGRYRDQDNGMPIDASGELSGVAGGTVSLDGLQDLSDYLASSEEARSCLVRYWSYFTYGRDVWDNRECNHDAIRAEARERDHGLQSTLFAILHAPHFTRRVAD